MTIEEFIYTQLSEVNSLKALQLLKAIYENQESDGWCKLGYLDFMNIGFAPESLRRTLKLLQAKKLIEIQEQDRKQGSKGQLSHKYRVLLSEKPVMIIKKQITRINQLKMHKQK